MPIRLLKSFFQRGISLNDEKKLGTEKIGKLMLSMGVPTLTAQLINLLYNIVDRIYIGHIPNVGADALTGLGLTMPVIMIISAFSMLLGAGGAPLAGIDMGRGDMKSAEKIIGSCAGTLVICSVVLTAVFAVFEKPLLYLIGASDVTLPYAVKYLSIYLCGTLFVQLTLGLNLFLTAQGKAKTAMLSVLIGAVINIILDPVLIFAMHMGIAGAALATVFSQFCSCVWVVKSLTGKNTALKIKKENLKPDPAVLKRIMALGISPFIMQSTESLISIVLNSSLQKYGGDLYVGSLTILQSVMQLISVPINGFTQGIQPILSYNFGAGNIQRVKKVSVRVMICTVSVSGLLALAAVLFPKAFVGIFTSDRALADLSAKVLPIFVFGMLIFGLQMGSQTIFLGLGQAKLSLFAALLRKVILLTPLALILPAVTKNVMGIYYAEPIADITAALICFTMLLINYKKILAKAPGKN